MDTEPPPASASNWKSASVSVIDDDVVLLHDTGPPLPAEEEDAPLGFWDHLTQQGGEWMWDHVLGNKNMDWFRDALLEGTAMMVADGSYSRDLDPHLCGTGWVIVCTRSRNVVKGSFFERSLTASSYRGELLGMVAIHALVATAAAVYDLPVNHGSIHCDNLGALAKARAQPTGEVVPETGRPRESYKGDEAGSVSATSLSVRKVAPRRHQAVGGSYSRSAVECHLRYTSKAGSGMRAFDRRGG